MAHNENSPSKSKAKSCSKRCSMWFSDAIFACFCGGFLNPRGEGSRKFYEVLDVPKTATHDDIRVAYRAKSLQYHPDKLRQRGETLSESNAEEFRKIKRAYEVLSDPSRRKTYDTLGINGIELKEEPTTFFSDQSRMETMIAKADKRAYFVIFLSFCLALAYLVVTPVLLALQVDNTIDIKWSLIFLPLWIIYGFILIAVLLAVARGETDRPEGLADDAVWEDTDPLQARQIALVVFTLFVLFQVLIIVKLDGGLEDASWMVVLIPYYAFELCLIYGAFHARNAAEESMNINEMAAATKANNTGEEEGNLLGTNLGFEELQMAELRRQQMHVAHMQLVFYSFRLLQVILIGLKVSFVIEAGWWVVLIPSMVYVCLLCCACTNDRAEAVHAKQSLDDLEQERPPLAVPSLRETLEREYQKSEKARKFEHHSKQGASEYFSCCCWSLYVLLFGFYLNNPDDDDFSFFYFYLPWAILICTPILCICLLSFCRGFGALPDEAEDGGMGPYASSEIYIDINGLDATRVQESLREVGIMTSQMNTARTHIVVNVENGPAAQAVIQNMRVEQQSTRKSDTVPNYSQEVIDGTTTERSNDPSIEDID